MSKIKWTVTKLKVLASMRELALKRFNKLDTQLRKVCTHPKSMRYTTSEYHTDTLGSNGYSEYQDHCSCCGAYIDSPYDGDNRYGAAVNHPHYPLKER